MTTDGAVFIDGIQYRSAPPALLSDQYQNDTPSKSELRQFKHLINRLPWMVYRVRNEPGRPIEHVSEGCRAVTGYDPNAFIVGGISYGADLIHRDNRAHVWQIVQEAPKNEEPFHPAYRIRTAENIEK